MTAREKKNEKFNGAFLIVKILSTEHHFKGNTLENRVFYRLVNFLLGEQCNNNNILSLNIVERVKER